MGLPGRARDQCDDFGRPVGGRGRPLTGSPSRRAAAISTGGSSRVVCSASPPRLCRSKAMASDAAT